MQASTDLMKQVSHLIEVIEDAFVQMEKQVEAQRYQETILLLENAMKGIESLQKVVQAMAAKVPESNFNEATQSFMEAVGCFLENYNQNQTDQMSQQMNQGVIPAFTQWKQEAEKALEAWNQGNIEDKE